MTNACRSPFCGGLIAAEEDGAGRCDKCALRYTGDGWTTIVGPVEVFFVGVITVALIAGPGK